MVDEIRGESGRIERRSALRGGAGTASGPSVKTQGPWPNGPTKMRPVARTRAELAHSNPSSPRLYNSPRGATGANRTAMSASPVVRLRMRSDASLYRK